MKKCLVVILAIVMCSCKFKPKKEMLYGSWGKEIVNYDELTRYAEINKNDTVEILAEEDPSPLRFYPYGFAIDSTSFEVFNAYRENIDDSYAINYMGNKSPYKLSNDSLYVLKPTDKDWFFLWKIHKVLKDTLFITLNTGKKRKYIRLRDYTKRNDFDQIVFSSSGCYGTCPILDISINKNGNVLFQGEKYINQIGFFEKQLSKEETAYIFSKFNKLDLLKLNDKYMVGHTDDEDYTVTLIKDGKIVKTIMDYGLVAPRELFWAYDRIKNIHNKYQLDTLKSKHVFYPKLNYFSFSKDSLLLDLEKSESFYLWSELNKSKVFNAEIADSTLNYELIFKRNYTFFSNNDSELSKKPTTIKQIHTDGRYYKIVYSKEKSKIIDLGYNFLDRNFETADFNSNKRY